VAGLEQVDPGGIQDLGQRFFADQSLCLAAIGPLSQMELSGEFNHVLD